VIVLFKLIFIFDFYLLVGRYLGTFLPIVDFAVEKVTFTLIAHKNYYSKKA